MSKFFTTPSISFFLTIGAIAGISGFSIQGYRLIEGPQNNSATAGQTSIIGEQGPAGPAGSPGATGPAGATGLAGPMGPTGAQGLMGPRGAKGEPGIQGVQGVPGVAGEKGAAGATGPAGPSGATGATGATGPMGPTGVAVAISPLIYDSNTKTLSLDLDAFQRIGSLDYLQFNPNSTAANAPGRLVWNNDDGTLNLQGIGGGVTLQIGQESVQRVRNNGATTLLNGRAVRITGSIGTRMTVEYADNSTAAAATSVIGVLTQDIAPGADGYVTTYGLIHAVNTFGFSPGAPLYLDGGGTLTSVRPSNGRIVQLGYAVSISSTDGVIYVNPLENFQPNIGGICTVPGQTGSGVYAWHNLSGARWIVVCDY